VAGKVADSLFIAGRWPAYREPARHIESSCTKTPGTMNVIGRTWQIERLKRSRFGKSPHNTAPHVCRPMARLQRSVRKAGVVNRSAHDVPVSMILSAAPATTALLST